MGLLGKRNPLEKKEGAPTFHSKLIWVTKVVKTALIRYYGIDENGNKVSVTVGEEDDKTGLEPKVLSMVFFCEQIGMNASGVPVFDLENPTFEYVCEDKIVHQPQHRTILGGWYAWGDFMQTVLKEDSKARGLKAGDLTDILYGVEFAFENEEIRRRAVGN